MQQQESLRELIGSLESSEAAGARQLIGMSLLLGATGISIVRHFLDSVLLFSLGRVLLFGLENIGVTTDQVQLVHLVSKWFEVTIFSTFAIFCFVEIVAARIRK